MNQIMCSILGLYLFIVIVNKYMCNANIYTAAAVVFMIYKTNFQFQMVKTNTYLYDTER